MSERPNDRAVVDALVRTDFASMVGKTASTVSPGAEYIANWHIRAMAYQLERVRVGEINRLLITAPPRSLKSIASSVAYPAYVLGHDPTKRIVCVSYAENLVEKHARDCRAVMETDWFKRTFPGTRISRHKTAELDFETTRKGGRYSVSYGGALTGRGGSLIVIDDPQKPADALSPKMRASLKDWFGNTLASRLDDQRKDAIVVVMQRLHVDDLAGHLLEQGGWFHLNLPAIAPTDEHYELGDGAVHHRRQGQPLEPVRLPLEELERLKISMGSFHFNAQFLQDPVPETGNLIRWEWFGKYDAPPSPTDRGRIVQSWDFAVKDGEQNDWTVCLTSAATRSHYWTCSVVGSTTLNSAGRSPDSPANTMPK